MTPMMPMMSPTLLRPEMILIAVDGTAASGKGTLARLLAGELCLAYLDTGSLYRGVALSLLKAGIGNPTTETAPSQATTEAALSSSALSQAAPSPSALEEAATKAAKSLNIGITKDPEIRSDAAGALASIVAAMPPVRAALLDYQRRFTEHIPRGLKGAILDGRDIGTIVLPHADYKFFVDADPRIRAERRLKELQSRGGNRDSRGGEPTLEAVLNALIARDERDKGRTIAPLKCAPDAIWVDTSTKTVDEMVTFALNAIKEGA